MKKIIIACLAILSIVAVLTVFNVRENQSWPSVDNGLGSGLGALRILLDRDGYKTAKSLSPAPQLKPEEVAVVPLIVSDYETPLMVLQGQGRRTESPLQKRLSQHLKSGGRIIVLGILPSLPLTTAPEAQAYEVSRPDDREEVLNATSVFRDDAEDSSDWVENAPDRLLGLKGPAPLWTYSDDEPLSVLFSEGKGMVVWVRPGWIASNRFLDREDNAEIILDNVRRAAPPGSRLVFLEAAFGNSEEYSIWTLFGGSGVAARYQLMLLAIVVAFTLGIRFGAPYVPRFGQRTSRDMIDAMAEVLRGGGHRKAALKTLASESDHRIRRLFKAPPETPINQLLAKMEPEAREAYLRVTDLSQSDEKVSSSDALSAAKSLDAALTALEHDSRKLTEQKLQGKG